MPQRPRMPERLHPRKLSPQLCYFSLTTFPCRGGGQEQTPTQFSNVGFRGWGQAYSQRPQTPRSALPPSPATSRCLRKRKSKSAPSWQMFGSFLICSKVLSPRPLPLASLFPQLGLAGGTLFRHPGRREWGGNEHVWCLGNGLGYRASQLPRRKHRFVCWSL